jgi:hypothetical protein
MIPSATVRFIAQSIKFDFMGLVHSVLPFFDLFEKRKNPVNYKKKQTLPPRK